MGNRFEDLSRKPIGRRAILSGLALAPTALLAACQRPDRPITIGELLPLKTTPTPVKPDVQAAIDAAVKGTMTAQQGAPRPSESAKPVAARPPEKATIPTAPPKEKERKLNDLEVITLKKWLEFFNKTQTIPYQSLPGLSEPETQFVTRSEGPEFNKFSRGLDDEVLSNSGSPLRLSWFQYLYWPHGFGSHATKSYGEIEIADIEVVTAPYNASPTDQRNGILYKGITHVKFNSRRTNIKVNPKNTKIDPIADPKGANAFLSVPEAQQRAWALAKEPQPYPGFSPWEQDYSPTMELILTTGNQYSINIPDTSGPLKYPISPSRHILMKSYEGRECKPGATGCIKITS